MEKESSDDILMKLTQALRSDGDFPASAKVVNKLKELTNDPRTTAQQITEVILHEPSLSTRILHLVNSSFYRRAKPIMTVSQAVVAVGMKSIADLCGGVILLQRFIPMAKKGGPFADCFKRSMITSLISSSFSAEVGGKSEGASNELGYISGFFLEIGTVLLAYYFPKVYESAVIRAKSKNISIADSLQQITGYSPIAISTEVVKALGLPSFYLEVLKASTDPSRLAQQNIRSLEEEKIVIAGRSVGGGFTVSAAIEEGTPEAVNKALLKVKEQFNIEPETCKKLLGNLDTVFRDHCTISEINLPPLPDFIIAYGAKDDGSTPIDAADKDGQRFLGFVEEIKLAVQNREPVASIITSVMEALKFGLAFDRVVLLLFDASKKNLVGRMALGVDGFRAGVLIRPIDARGTMETIALRDGRIVLQGDSLLEGGWPLAALPIGNSKKGLGVIYADRIKKEEELTDREKANISILADLLDRTIGVVK